MKIIKGTFASLLALLFMGANLFAEPAIVFDIGG